MSLAPQDAQLVSHLQRARRILFFTGAGISTASGIPDFRGPNGVWTRRQPVCYDDFLQSHEARVEHWDFKLESWPHFQAARPNAIHQAMARIAKAGRLAGVVTQNIDGLHALAGIAEKDLVELHGNNLKVACVLCGREHEPDPIYEAFAATRQPPVCACSPRGWLKPATISFGQSLVTEDLIRAEEMAHEADLIFALGSTLSVYPAAGVPLVAAQRGVPYIIINRGETEHDHLPQVTLRIEGDVLDLFPSAVDTALD